MSTAHIGHHRNTCLLLCQQEVFPTGEKGCIEEDGTGGSSASVAGESPFSVELEKREECIPRVAESLIS